MPLPPISIVIPYCQDGIKLDETIEILLAERARWNIQEILLCHNGIGGKYYPSESLNDALQGIIKVCHRDEAGIGVGYELGISGASSEYVLLSASDLPFGFSDLQALERLILMEGNTPSVAVGSKLHPETILEGYSLVRRVFSLGLWSIRRLLLGRGLPRDTQGTIFVKTDLARSLLPLCKYRNFVFSLEFLCFAREDNQRIREIPVVYRPSKEQSSSVKVVRETVEFLKGIVDLRRRVQASK